MAKSEKIRVMISSRWKTNIFLPGKDGPAVRGPYRPEEEYWVAGFMAQAKSAFRLLD